VMRGFQQDDRILKTQQVIKKLRHDDLNEGHCFMIFDDGLPENEAYYEYPDGRIQIEQLVKDDIYAPRIVIRALTKEETAMLKEKHEVFR
jgi:hypothetical protein